VSSSGRPAARFRLSRCGWAALVVAVAMFLVTVAGPALAHSDLVSSDPEDGSTVTSPPRTIVLVFNETVQDTGSAVVVTGPEDQRIDDPASLQVDGPRVVAVVDGQAPSGAYTVAYRVVSADGHVITGSVRYRLDRPASSPSPTVGSPTADSPTAEPTVPGGTSPAAEVVPAAGTSDASAGLPWLALLAVVGVAVVALVLVLRWARRARD
jgi:methionine-rich copper-binding protein CopC